MASMIKDNAGKFKTAIAGQPADSVSKAIEAAAAALTANDGQASSQGDKFDKLRDAAVLMLVSMLAGRPTVDQVDLSLTDCGVDGNTAKALARGYAKLTSYLDTCDSIAVDTIAGKSCYRLIDFRWEMRETLADTQADIGKTNLVLGELVYLDTRNSNVKKLRCLLPADVIESIARESELAVNVFKDLKESYN